ncbi:hypothetical protein PVK06_027421 [Gossypium arboreum]|uniref:Uncharacterized protein n=1 Tax=Gossypium arboreum TaxID=29729 RepID=A0ABR0P078_GOSAR|nr:hypothetical protein PVK06_027421 [Gossypium arboreum]
MTHGKDTSTMKEAETSKTRKGKTTAENKGTNLTSETSLLRRKNYIEKLTNSINNNLVEGEVITGKELSTVEEEVVVEEEDIRVEIVNEKAEEENTETEVAKKESVEDIVNASDFVDATKDNLEQDRARPEEAAEITPRIATAPDSYPDRNKKA